MELKTEANTAFQKHLNELVSQLPTLQAQVGWFESNKYPDAKATPVAVAAYSSEFGVPQKGVPPRPFIRPAVDHNTWGRSAEVLSKRVLAGKMTSKAALETLADIAKGNIAENIQNVFTPPLKPQTIKARKSKYADKQKTGLLDKPLVDTGLMFATIGAKVVG